MGARRDRALAHQQPEGCNSDQAWKKRPEKNFAVRMAGRFEEPKGAEWAGDGAERVHQAFETERAAIGVRRNVSGQKRFPRGGTDAAPKPGPGASQEHLIGVTCQSERRGAQRGESVAE